MQKGCRLPALAYRQAGDPLCPRFIGGASRGVDFDFASWYKGSVNAQGLMVELLITILSFPMRKAKKTIIKTDGPLTLADVTRGMCAVLLLTALVAPSVSIGRFHIALAAEEEVPQEEPLPPVLGSARFCKVVLDASGVPVTAENPAPLPAVTFSVAGFTPSQTSGPAPTGEVGTANFPLPLTLNTDLLGLDGVMDAQCETWSDIPVGSYYYAEEAVPSGWLSPKYNDQFDVVFSTLANSFVYDRNLFDGDASNDEVRNQNADGHILLTESIPNRTLVVVNQLAEPFDPERKGSIRVCKAIIDLEGVLLDANSETEVPSASFSVSGITPGQTSLGTPAGEFGTAIFETPLSFNADIFGGDQVSDAECVTFGELTLGGYYYDEEVLPVVGWSVPKYNDQFTAAISTVNDLFVYDANVLDGDSGNDGARNQNADGHINLTYERPDRTLVVLNQIGQPGGDGDGGGGGGDGSENTEELCADEIDNDNDELIDAHDPDCAPFEDGEEGGGTGGGGTGGGSGSENTQPLCTDGGDNDSDGLIDLLDPDCGPVMGVGPGQGGEGGGGASGGTGAPGGSGGGGGGGAVLGASTGGGSGEPAGEVLGEATCGGPLLTDYMRMGMANDPEQVKLLQQFLNDHMGANLPASGFFGQLTHDAVSNFQVKYWEEILKPWVPYGLPSDHTPTGYVYKTTKRMINNLACPELQEPMPQLP
jgi:hypothetical protein